MSSFVPFSITVCGIEELEGHCEARVSHVLSILDPGWPVPPAFGSFGEHERLELRFHDIIEPADDEVVPEEAHVAELLAFGRDLDAEAGAHLLVHCHAGISRSTASMALILAQARPDAPAADVFAEVLRIRAKAWPNLRMIEMGDALLGRGGALVAAVPALYRHQLELRPQLAEFMAGSRRHRELRAAGWAAEG